MTTMHLRDDVKQFDMADRPQDLGLSMIKIHIIRKVEIYSIFIFNIIS